jgi:glycine cleavage system transcriptional repressor
MQEIVITAVGKDRAGLVDELTGFLLEAGANMADSRMVNLRGQFALIALVECNEQQAATIISQAPAVGERIGLKVSVAPQGSGKDSVGDGVPYRVKAYAMDQPGLVHRITHFLHQQGVNIEELQTKLAPGSYTGTPLFTLDLRMTIPTSVKPKQLRVQLEELCDSLNCDVDVEPI